MKKLVIIFAMLGLMFNVIGCTGKKAQDDTDIIENADVEKIEAEEANFAGNESTVETGPVDESLQAALGETPSAEVIATDAGSAATDTTIAATDAVNTEIQTDLNIAETPVLDESNLAVPDVPAVEVAANNVVDSGITETPVIETPVEVAQTQVDTGLAPETQIIGGVTEMNTVASNSNLTETPIIETPVNESESSFIAAEKNEKITSDKVTVTSEAAVISSVSSKNPLLKISETVPYKHNEGFVNTVYIARPKEKLANISTAIYGMDKSSELKSINSFLRSRSPKGGDKIYYISPNRPTDANRTISFYEDTGMIATNYSSEKGESLAAVSKKLLGYDNAWKEIWTTNSIQSKTKLAAGETIRYWKAMDQVPTTLAKIDGNSKLIDSSAQMPSQQVAMNTTPPAELPTAQPQDNSQLPQAAMNNELPPPPPPIPDANAAAVAMNQPPVDGNTNPPQAAMNNELPPPPPAEIPAPPAENLAAEPVPPNDLAKQKVANNMEEEPAAESEGLSSDTTTMMGVVAVLVAALGFVLVRRNKKKKESDLSSIEQNHVGS